MQHLTRSYAGNGSSARMAAMPASAFTLSSKQKSTKELLLQQDMGLCTNRKLNVPSMVGTKLLVP